MNLLRPEKHALMLLTLCLIFILLSPVVQAACGSNEGWLPWLTRSSAPDYLPSSVKKTLTQTNHCGATREVSATSASATWHSCDTTTGLTGWQPKRNTICKNVPFTETCSRWNKERRVYGSWQGTNWQPARNTVCEGNSFSQTSSCGVIRQTTGTKSCCGDWSPAANTVCSTETLTQSNQCGATRQVNGTKDCCVPEPWSPKPNQMCAGMTFTQNNGCGQTQQSVGTNDSACILEDNSQLDLNEGDFPHDPKIARVTSKDLLGSEKVGADATNSVKLFSRRMPDDRGGALEYYPIVITATNAVQTQMPIFTRGDDLGAFFRAQAKGSLANDPKPSDPTHFCLDTDYPTFPIAATCVDSGPRTTACGAHQMVQNCACGFNTKGTWFPLCDECEGKTESRVVGYTVTSTGWQGENPANICIGEFASQYDNCGATREVPGTRDCGGDNEPEPQTMWEFVGRNSPASILPANQNHSERSCMVWFLSSPNTHQSRLWALTYGIDSNYACSRPGAPDFCYQTLVNGAPGIPNGCPVSGELCGSGYEGVAFQRHNFRCQ